MSLRRTSSISTNDTACIDFREGFLQNKAAEAPSVIETLRSEIAELKSKIDKPVPIEKSTALETKLEAKSYKPHHRSSRHSKECEFHSRRQKPDVESDLPSEVINKISALEGHIAKQEAQAKSHDMAQTVMAKLSNLESRLKPDEAVLSKLQTIESNVSHDVMAKLQSLESRLMAAKPADPVSSEVMAKLDRLETKLESTGKYDSAMAKLGALQSHLQSEQSVKQEVHDKLSRLEEHVKLKTGAPLLALEKNYHQELEHLDKLERLRARVAAAH